MRTPLLVAALSLSIIGCTIGDSGTAPGGDDTSDPGDPGTGTGTNPGSGTPTSTPSVTSSVDRATVATELGKSEIITLNLKSVGGFTGAVTVAPSFVDAAGNPVANAVTGEASVTLAANATTPVMYTVKIPTDFTGADTTGTLKLDVTSSAGTTHLTSAFTVAAVLTVVYANGLAANQAAHPGRADPAYSVKLGTKIMLKNEDATPSTVHITHADGAFPHETTGPTGGLFGNTYVIDTAKNKVGDTGNIGCHSHGTPTYSKVTIVQ